MDLVLDFEGYWPIDATGVANYAGIYCVYAVSWDELNPSSRLLYIGGTDNIARRIAYHNQKETFKEIAGDLPLYFNACPITKRDGRDKAEAAMIHHHCPPCNIKFNMNLLHRSVTLTTTGKNANLTPGFVTIEYMRAKDKHSALTLAHT